MKQRDEVLEAMENATRLDAVELWFENLDKFEAAYTQFEAEREERRARNLKDAAHATRKSTSKVKIT
jgi:hypothetical protein